MCLSVHGVFGGLLQSRKFMPPPSPKTLLSNLFKSHCSPTSPSFGRSSVKDHTCLDGKK